MILLCMTTMSFAANYYVITKDTDRYRKSKLRGATWGDCYKGDTIKALFETDEYIKISAEGHEYYIDKRHTQFLYSDTPEDANKFTLELPFVEYWHLSAVAVSLLVLIGVLAAFRRAFVFRMLLMVLLGIVEIYYHFMDNADPVWFDDIESIDSGWPTVLGFLTVGAMVCAQIYLLILMGREFNDRTSSKVSWNAGLIIWFLYPVLAWVIGWKEEFTPHRYEYALAGISFLLSIFSLIAIVQILMGKCKFFGLFSIPVFWIFGYGTMIMTCHFIIMLAIVLLVVIIISELVGGNGRRKKKPVFDAETSTGVPLTKTGMDTYADKNGNTFRERNGRLTQE